MKYFLILSVFISFYSSAQIEAEIREVLNEINSIEDIEIIKPIVPDWDLYDVVITPFEYAGDTSIINSPLMSVHEYQNNNGKNKYLLKVLNKEKKEFCRLKYILVNSANLNSKEIDKLQEQVISEYHAGKTIQELVEKYNQDRNPTGELGWFSTNMMVAEFEKAVWDKKIDDIIKVNIPDRNWHYVVFKTHSNIVAEVANCVRIKICQIGCPDSEMEMPEQAAEYPGGFPALSQFIADTLEYPLQSIKDKIEGIVILLFVVEIDGSISNVIIEKGVSDELNIEAKRIVELMPRWIPATYNGMKVRSQCRLPINFTL